MHQIAPDGAHHMEALEAKAVEQHRNAHEKEIEIVQQLGERLAPCGNPDPAQAAPGARHAPE